MTGQHHVKRYADEGGFVASCACGFRVRYRDRDRREQKAREHEAIDTLTVRRINDGRNG